jgi:hypothetical protein
MFFKQYLIGIDERGVFINPTLLALAAPSDYAAVS